MTKIVAKERLNLRSVFMLIGMKYDKILYYTMFICANYKSFIFLFYYLSIHILFQFGYSNNTSTAYRRRPTVPFGPGGRHRPWPRT